MSRQVSPSTDKVYGLQRVRRCWGVARATIYRHRHPTQAVERKRPGLFGAIDRLTPPRHSCRSPPTEF